MKLKNILKAVAWIEIVLGIFLLLREIYDYIRFPSIQEANEFMGGIVNFHKYEEDCYILFCLYSLIIITGLSLWINKRLHWGLSQTLLFTLLFIILIDLDTMRSSIPWFSTVLEILSLLAFVCIELKMYSFVVMNEMKVTKLTICLSVVGGIIFSYIWWYL